jgi:hypothetical protein
MSNLFVQIKSELIKDFSFDEMMEFKAKYKLRLPTRDEAKSIYQKIRYNSEFINYVVGESIDDKLRLQLILSGAVETF